MDTIKLAGEVRTQFGKGFARRLRAAGKVPAVLYGHGTDPIHLALPGHETLLALREANALLTIEIPGEKDQLALPKQVQRDPIKGFIEHVDLLLVKRGEKVQVDVAIVATGEAARETLVNVEPSIAVMAEATNIPTEIEVSIEGLEVGAQILASDLELPQGVEIAVDPETLVVNVTAPISEAALEADLAVEGEGDEAAAEAEGEEEKAEEA